MGYKRSSKTLVAVESTATTRLRYIAVAVVLLMTLVMAPGCGLGAGKQTQGGLEMLVTEDFGYTVIGKKKVKQFRSSDTVMRLMQKSFKVKTRYGGGFIQSINKRSGGIRKGRNFDWFYYVNGVLAPKGAKQIKPHKGDRVWWDLHDWGVTMTIPAVVGSFPAPISNGIDGKRQPIRIDCTDNAQEACETVKSKLQTAGIKEISSARLGSAAGKDTMRILVGEWSEVSHDAAAARIDKGPELSGVFIKPSEDGSAFEVLDDQAKGVKTLTAGAGLVAAVKFEEQVPTWVITGTDIQGVNAAADALTEKRLSGKFALVTSGGTDTALPDVR